MDGARDLFKFVVATQSSPKHHSSVISESRAHSARATHRARRKRRENEDAQRRHSREGTSLSSSSSSDYQPSSSPDDFHQQQLTLQTAFKGSSDPFQATAIKMTPELNAVLSYMRDYVYPKLQFNQFFQHFASDPNQELSATSNTVCITSFPANEHWKLITSTLNDECSALASMSTAATYMATVSPASQVTALELRLQSSKYLRKLLARQKQDLSLLVTTLFWLFNAETRARNFEAAGILSRMLAPQIRHGFEAGRVSLMIIMEFRVVEDDVATHNLSKVNLDMDEWFPSLFEADWKQVEVLLPPHPFALDDIHPAVKWPLRQHFYNIRWIYFYWDRPFQCNSPHDQRLVFRWFMSRGQWVSGCLLNAYADITERSDQSEGDWLQCLLALTALNHTRVVGSSSLIGLVDYRGAAEPVVQQIKSLVQKIMNSVLNDRNVVDALLWVLYLGSSWEAISGRTGVDAWFRPRLLAHARVHSVRTWDACRFILKSFFFVEKDIPDSSTWFQNTVEGDYAFDGL